MRGLNSRRVIEYATQYITRQGFPRNVYEQILIFLGQEAEEGYIEKQGVCDYIICDSASFLACVYANFYKPSNPLDKESMAKFNYVIKKLNSWARERTIISYNFIFYLPFELEYVEDGVRYQNKEEARLVSDLIKAYLDLERINYFVIKGNLEERIKSVLDILRLS